MDNLIKIRVKSAIMHGKTVKLPIAGATKISKKGIIKVTQEVAELLLTNRNDYELDEKEKKVIEEDEEEEDGGVDGGEEGDDEEEDTEGDDEEEDEEEEDEEEEDETPLTKESLQALEIEDIIQILKDSEVEESKYAKFVDKKGLLINFVLKTLK